ncbi:MAG: type 4a pilus biogenesis protein PilO [Syntrophales bacterium]
MKRKMIRYLDRAGLTIVIVTVIGGLLWIGGNSFTHKRQLQQEKDYAVREWTDLKLAEGNINSLKTARSQVQNDTANLFLRIPPHIEMGALIKKLHARMKERQITLATLQPQAPVSEELYTKIPIRLVFQGSFVQIYRFFYDMETMEQLLIPGKITISGPESAQGNCQVELTLLAFETKAPGPGR